MKVEMFMFIHLIVQFNVTFKATRSKVHILVKIFCPPHKIQGYCL